jgi:peroxiredoxin
MKNKISLVAFLIPVLMLGWIFLTRVPPSSLPPSSLEAPKEGFLAPGFNLNSLSNDEYQISSYSGKPIILNFWASWCPPCRAEMPDFQQAWEEYQETDLQIIAVNATNQDSLPEISRFLTSHQVDFPILLDPSGSTSSAYQIHSLPTTFFINRSGVITKIIIGGPVPLSLLRIQADQLLKE